MKTSLGYIKHLHSCALLTAEVGSHTIALTRASADIATCAVWLIKLTMELMPMQDAPHMRKHAPHQPRLFGRNASSFSLHMHCTLSQGNSKPLLYRAWHTARAALQNTPSIYQEWRIWCQSRHLPACVVRVITHEGVPSHQTLGSYLVSCQPCVHFGRRSLTQACAHCSHAASKHASASPGLCCWPPAPSEMYQWPLWSALPAQV
jgi:hypothetical protein